jgi:hypothetical protein
MSRDWVFMGIRQGGLAMMLIEVQDERERLVAEQALLAFRAMDQARDSAPHGRGLEAIEEVAVSQGLGVVRQMVQQSLSAHEEAQKKEGSVSGGATAGARPSSSGALRKT